VLLLVTEGLLNVLDMELVGLHVWSSFDDKVKIMVHSFSFWLFLFF
jgi:hypothetical protein